MERLRILILGLPLYAAVALYFAVMPITSYFVLMVDPAIFLFMFLGFPLMFYRDFPHPAIGVLITAFMFVFCHIIFWTPISLLIIKLVEERDGKEHAPLMPAFLMSKKRQLITVACVAAFVAILTLNGVYRFL